ncbi:alpha/beta hydrolase [Sphingomonas sp.]|uniref:alpha/beta hydrolase n=1 Tax=Sphingomonas sp. TaxID=28214 RepID=UPI002FC6E4AE
MKSILSVALFIVGTYTAIVVLIYFLQTAMLFPAGAAREGPPLPPGAERLRLATSDGETLQGVHLTPGARPNEGERPVILGFGGNTWDADAAALYLQQVYPEADIVTFHFRGYHPSSGTPSAAGLLRDAPAVHDLVARRFPARPVVAVGFSVGSGVAAHLASARPLAGVILVTPFDRLARVARDHYPWLPVRALFRHDMNAVEALRGATIPVAIIAAGADDIIPPARTEALRGTLRTLVYDRTIPHAGHNDVYDRADFREAMKEALAAIVRGRGPKPSAA